MNRPAQAREPRTRMSPDKRRAWIIEESIGYFATHGFAVDTRSLAKHLKVTQALLYKYFPSKQQLVSAVFDTVFRKNSAQKWIDVLRDRSTDLRTRLFRFFLGYAQDTYDYDWIRVYTQAAFSGGDLNRGYITRVTRPIFEAIAQEARVSMGLPFVDPGDISELEIEVLWVFHFGLYYYPYRTHVYGMPPSVPLADVVNASLDGLISNLQRCVVSALASTSTSKSTTVN